MLIEVLLLPWKAVVMMCALSGLMLVSKAPEELVRWIHSKNTGPKARIRGRL